jgi:hypothetical protein
VAGDADGRVITFSKNVLPPKLAYTTLPAITGTAKVGSLLSAWMGGWTGPPPILFAFHWQRCSSTGCVNIRHATQADYVPVTADRGKALRVIVWASEDGNPPQAGRGPSAKSPKTAPIA